MCAFAVVPSALEGYLHYLLAFTLFPMGSLQVFVCPVFPYIMYPFPLRCFLGSSLFLIFSNFIMPSDVVSLGLFCFVLLGFLCL